MTTDRKDLETRLIATDKASKVIEHVADDLDKLERKGDVEVELTAKDKASDDIRTLDKRLAGLSDEDKTIVLRAQAKDAQRDIDRILRSMRDVGKVDDETVKIRIDALGDARTELKQIQEQADKLDKEKVDVTVDADTTTIRGKFAQLKRDLDEQATTFGKLGTLGKTAFANLGTYATQGVAVAGAAVAAFVGDAISDFDKLALEVGQASDALGIPTEQVSALKEVSEDLSISFDAVKTAIGRMNRTAESSPAAFAGINAAVVRSDDGALDVMSTFLGVAEALRRIPDAGERAVAGTKIFGKSWMTLSELIMKGNEGIVASMADVEAGKIVSPEDVANARHLRDATDALRDKIEALANTIGKELTPVLATATDGLGTFTEVFKNFAKVATSDFGDIPILKDLGFLKYTGLIGTYKLFGDVIGEVRGEWDDFRGTVHGTVGDIQPVVGTLDDLNVILGDLAAKDDPLGTLPDQWKILMDDMRDGSVTTLAAKDAVDLLAAALDIDPTAVLTIARSGLADEMDAAATAAQDYRQAVEDIAGQVADVQTGIDEWNTSVQETQVSTADLMATFDASKVDAVTTALGDFLAARQPGVGWLDTLANTKEAFRDIWTDIKGNEDAIPDIFAVSTEKGRDFRDAIDAASQAVNQQLLQALENAGGDFAKVREQADALREAMIKKIEMRTGLSMDVPAERTKILGLVNAMIPPDKKLQVGIEIAKKDLEKLKADLAIETLQGLLPATALQLQVDLAEGDITPAEAAATAQEILNQNGVDVDLDVNTKKADEDLVDFAKKERDTAMGVVIPDKELVGAAGTILAGPGGRGWPPIKVPVIPVWSNGATGSSGVGPIPTSTPTGLVGATTTVATTAGMAPLRVPVSGRTQVVNQHLTINTAVMGDPFAVTAVVDEAMRRGARLLPKTP